ncbi:hypothetical protein IWQ51_001498 [Labrenzia sp. EL_142]|nr:hypothetical protein [Labrenzia sp. EL_142]
MSATIDYIDEILSGLLFSEFLEGFWERSPRLSRGVLRDPQSLFDTSALEACIAASSPKVGHIPSIVSGQIARPMSDTELRAPTNTAIAAYNCGATILAPRVELSIPKVAILCRQLDNAFLSHGLPIKQATFANAYLTPASTQGFGAHYDDHCVFVLQMWGSKHWVVAPPENPLPSERCTEVIPDDAAKTKLLEIDLRAGDVLYVPRGFVHYARCTHEPSLHLTVGIRTLTWADLMPRLANKLASFRESVRPVSCEGMPANQYYSDRLVASLGGIDPTMALLSELGASLSTLSPITPSSGSRFSDQTLSESTVLRRNRDVMVMLALEGNNAMFHFPGGPLEMPAAMETALEFVANMEQFSVCEIPQGRAEFDKLQLAKLLIGKGIVSVKAEETSPVEIESKKEQSCHAL